MSFSVSSKQLCVLNLPIDIYCKLNSFKTFLINCRLIGDALAKDKVIQKGMPGEMYRLFHEYKHDEWARFMSTVTDWDEETYMECLP